MNKEKLYDITSPKIDIELCTRDSNMPAIDKVHNMDEDSFEFFTNEWLYGCYRNKYAKIQRIGGAGDKGRDIIGTYQDGTVDYYQCKHYQTALMPSQFYKEFGKLCYYTYKNEIQVPQKYYIIASNDLGPSLSDLIVNTSKLKNELLANWDNYCRNNISNVEIILESKLKEYIDNFDLSIVEHIPIAQVIDEHLKTEYGKLRFGGIRINVPNITQPDNIEESELPYVNALLEVYSEDSNLSLQSTDDLKKHNDYYTHFQRQRHDYYSIETIRRFVRDTFTDDNDFLCLKDEVYNGIIDVYEENFENGYRRLKEVLKQASQINTSKVLLDSYLHLIGPSEKKGTCHLLVNDDKLRWKK